MLKTCCVAKSLLHILCFIVIIICNFFPFPFFKIHLFTYIKDFVYFEDFIYLFLLREIEIARARRREKQALC